MSEQDPPQQPEQERPETAWPPPRPEERRTQPEPTQPEPTQPEPTPQGVPQPWGAPTRVPPRYASPGGLAPYPPAAHVGPGWGAPQYGAPQYGAPQYAAPQHGAPPYTPKPELPRFPHPEPREYHQMLRTWNYAWWKPVLGTVLVFVGMAVIAPLLLLPVLIVGVLSEDGSFTENFENAVTLQDVGPAALLYLNLSLGAAILVTWLVMRVVHRMRPRWLTSVVPKMRWKLFFVFVGLSVVALVAQILVSMLMPGEQEADLTAQVNPITASTIALAAVVLLTTPFQAAGEEYVFRGYLLQAIGSFWSLPQLPPWVGRWLAIVITSVLFALGHGIQNFPLFFDRFMFGMIAGWLVIRTGGLEAGIAMHILNNFLAFGFALLFSDISSSLTATEIGWENVPLTLTQAGVYAALVLLAARKMKVQRRTSPPPQPGTRLEPDGSLGEPAPVGTGP